MPKGKYIRTEEMKFGKTIHGMVGTRPYRIWGNMIGRCQNPKSTSFKNYGARGIEVCTKWQTFVGFWEDMANGYVDNLTIDRIDNNKGYEASNCRWSTLQFQQNNRRDTNLITFRGRTQNATQWCEELGLKVSTVLMRINGYGWSPERALETPVKSGSSRKKI